MACGQLDNASQVTTACSLRNISQISGDVKYNLFFIFHLGHMMNKKPQYDSLLKPSLLLS